MIAVLTKRREKKRDLTNLNAMEMDETIKEDEWSTCPAKVVVSRPRRPDKRSSSSDIIRLYIECASLRESRPEVTEQSTKECPEHNQHYKGWQPSSFVMVKISETQNELCLQLNGLQIK